MEVRLVDNPRDPLPYQIHAVQTWRDAVTGEQTSYLAGFQSEARREEFLKIIALEVTLA